MRLAICTFVIVTLTTTSQAAEGTTNWRQWVTVLRSETELQMKGETIAQACSGAIAHVLAQDNDKCLVCVERIDCWKARDCDDDLIFGWIDPRHLVNSDSLRTKADKGLQEPKERPQGTLLRGDVLFPGAVESDAAIGRGNIARLNENFQQAIEFFKQASDGPWMEYRARLHCAECYRRTDDFAEALEECEAAIRIFPSQGAAYLARARINGGIGEIAKAIEDCAEVLKLNPESSGARYCRAWCRLISGDLKAALVDSADWDELDAAELSSKSEDRPVKKEQHKRHSMPDVCRLGDIGIEPVASLACHTIVQPGFVEQLLVDAVSSEHHGDLTTSGRLLERLLECGQRRRTAIVTYYYRGRASIWTSNWQNAKFCFGEASRMVSKLSETQPPPVELELLQTEIANCTAGILCDNGQRSDAVAQLKSIVTDGRATSSTYLILGITQSLEMNLEEAESAVTFLIDRPEWGVMSQAAGFEGRAQVKMRKADLDGALRDLSSAIAIRPTYGGLRLARANLCVRLGQMEMAAGDCDVLLEHARAVEMKIRGFLMRGQIYLSKQQWERAVGDFDNLIELQPIKSENFTLRALAHRGSNQLGKAISDFREALQLNPRNEIALGEIAGICSATSEDLGVDSKAVVDCATRLCECTNYKESDCIEILAASLAHDGQYDKAIKRIEQAIELNPKSHIEIRKQMLELFSAGKPYRIESDAKE